MGAGTRVLLIDLLVERSEFGHGGNQEIVCPLANSGSVEVLLVTPQVQSEEAGRRAQENGEVAITEDDVPNWDDDFGFWAECDIEMGGNPVVFRRIAVPLHGDDTLTADWLGRISPDAVICTGSRHNVSIWENWMGSGASLLRSSASMGVPTLGICFGHQLLCKALGATVERADTLSNGVWDISLTNDGESDELFSSRRTGEGDSPVVLFTHRDHVMSVPDCCTLLGSTDHNGVSAVRVNGDDGIPLPAWGVQFHPEAAKARVERAFDWGHITREELEAFQREHDGAGILESFAAVVTGR